MIVRLIFILLLSLVSQLTSAENVTSQQRGKYLVEIAGCNDCHTKGYVSTGGKIPESEWLRGDTIGHYGPWGTTYASNLRLVASRMTVTEWIIITKNSKFRPPMPWFSLHAMKKQDLADIYSYIKSLGDIGVPAPNFLPLPARPPEPYINYPGAP